MNATGLVSVAGPVAKANDLFCFMEGALISARVRDDLSVVFRLRPVALRLIGVEPSDDSGPREIRAGTPPSSSAPSWSATQ